MLHLALGVEVLVLAAIENAHLVRRDLLVAARHRPDDHDKGHRDQQDHPRDQHGATRFGYQR